MSLLHQERAPALERTRVLSPWVGLIAAGAGLAWLPNLRRPPTPDEAGFLMVGAQWHAGSSLYGDYWVDRPPLLILVHGVAAVLGGLPALRGIGLICVVATVLLAGALGAEVARTAGAAQRRRISASTAVLGAALVISPALGAGATCGELLTTPVVMASILAALRATRDGVASAASVRRLVVAAVLAGLAPMLKQNALDGLVASALVLLVGPVLGGPRRRARLMLLALLAALGAVSAVVLAAALRGTEPRGLWDAVVTFRMQAGAVIAGEAPPGNDARGVLMARSLLGSGLPLTLLVLGVLVLRRRREPSAATTPRWSAWLAISLLGWETLAVLGGGSWWRHYLLDLVPGAVVLAAVALPRARRLPTVLLTILVPVVATAVGLAATIPRVMTAPAHGRDHALVAYLEAHVRPGDTGTVAFGRANLLYEAGLRSPYDELWSLPVRVRDPHLDAFIDVLEGPRAPTWVIVGGASVATWGVDHVDAVRADAVLARRYERVAEIRGEVIWRRQG